MSLCVPMTQVLLHAIIDDLRANDNKVFRVKEAKEKRWWEKTSVWIKIARVGLPVAYMMVALAIVVPGIINIIVQGSAEEWKMIH